MITISKATLQHIHDIATFQVAMAKETENLNLQQDVVEKGVKYFFDHPETGFYLLACYNEKVVGSLLLQYEWSEWRNAKIIWVHSVFIQPQFRGKGIYKKMYHKVQEIAFQNPEIAGIRLYVDKTNAVAKKVYEKMGMSARHYDLYEWMN
ncbi:MAG: GNAT family N-acetyltransferase [Bacteroidota bacterium]